MVGETPTASIPPTDSVRQEFPFIRPRLNRLYAICYAIPAVGAIVYLRDLNRIKGISTIETLRHMFSEFDIKEWLTLGVSTWPAPESLKESQESAKTALQNGLMVAYHYITVLTITLEAAKTIQS